MGSLTVWGKSSNYSMPLKPFPGITGWTNTGWHWKVFQNETGVDGSPSYFTVGTLNGTTSTSGDTTFQIPRGNFIVLSIVYPANAQFTVAVVSNPQDTWYPGGGLKSVLQMSTKAQVLNNTEPINTNSMMSCTDRTS